MKTEKSISGHCNHLRQKNRNSLFPKLFYPFLGIGSLIWFLVRVIPKPSRASYPCMRLAAPMASTFVLWLLGIGTSWIFLKQARVYILRSRHLTAVLCLFVGGITAGIFLSTPHSRSYASIKSNVPIGEAKGANPGRVVWVHDSSVSNWKGLGDGRWWEGNHTRQSVVDSMTSRTVRELRGKSTDSAAWDTLFRYYNKTHGRGSTCYKKGEKIAIKINLTFCNYFPDFCCVDSMNYHLNKKQDYMNTSPQVVRSLLRQLVYAAGIDQADISIGDPVAYYPFEYYDSCHAEFPNVHYVDHAGKFGRTKAEPSDIPLYWSCRPTVAKQDYIPKHYSEATYLINLANMKSHLGAGITLCAKNHYGSLRLPTQEGYYDLHQSLAFMTPKMGSYRAVVDLMGHSHLGGKTVLYLIDGLYAGNHNNDTVPHKWPVAPFNGNWTSSLFASQDPVAIECVLYDLFQLDDDPYQYPKIPGVEDYLIEAAQANNPPSGTFYDPNHATATERLPSLGVFEHWNNSIDRKYSRNLGTGNGIELLFIERAHTGIHLSENIQQNLTRYKIRFMHKTCFLELSIPVNDNIKLILFDNQGKLISTVYQGSVTAGTHKMNFFSLTKNSRISAGSYVLALYSGNINQTRRISACSVQIHER
jgi:hypothetical protein